MFTDHKKFAAAPKAANEQCQKVIAHDLPDGQRIEIGMPQELFDSISRHPAVRAQVVAQAGVSAEEKRALLDAPVVYGLPARTKEGPARVVFDEHYVMLVIHGVLVQKNYRRSYHVGKYEALRDEINAAAKRGVA